MRTAHALLVLSLSLVACGMDVPSAPQPLPHDMAHVADSGPSRPPPDVATPPSGLTTDPSPWYWWSDPNAATMPEYVGFIWGAASWRANGMPLSFHPMFDRALQAKCVYMQTTDSRWRCLPGWAQIDMQPFMVNGFYASNRIPWSYDDYRFALPASENQPYLVIYDVQARSYRVYEKLLETAPVYLCAFRAPTSSCERAPTDLRFYRKGAEVPATRFVALEDGGAPL